MTFVSIVITACLLYAQIVTCLYCVRHTSRQGGYSALDTCKINKNRPIAAAAALSNKIDTSTQQNNLTFDLTCKASASECQGVSATLSKATDIISDIFQFETPLVINASYVNFCQEYQDCHHDAKYASIGQAYPSISYVMMDNTDKMTRLYPQPLLKQYTNMSEKPSWTQYDIEAQFNNEINWYFANNADPIQSSQTDFLRNVVHELIHGLGFMTSWNDDFYEAILPLFDSGKIEHFITPTLLAQTNNHQLMSDYSANQPFWGFVEFPFDKYIHFKNNNTNSYTSFTSITQQLNHFSSSNATFRNMVDLANAWYNSDEYSSSKRLYTKAVTFLDVLAVIDNEPLLFLETSVNPFSSGSSLCHVDQSQYLNTTEYLMVYLANTGIDITQLEQMFPQGPIGPKLLKVMATLGYRVKSNVNTDRPSLSYWTPPQGLVGTGSNPSPSLSIVTAGPARLPTSSSSTPTAGSTSTNQSKSSFSPTAIPQYWHPLLLCIITLSLLWTALLLLAIVGGASAFNASALSKDYDNDRIIRVIDVSSSVVREEIGIRANYLGSEPTQVYFFVLPAMIHHDVATMEAFLKHKSKDALAMVFTGFDQEQQLYGYEIQLQEPLEYNSQVKLGIKLTYTHQIRPLPAKIPQVSKQHVTYSSSIFMPSPYHTSDIKTTFTFPTTNIVSFKGGEPHHQGQQTQNSIMYGPFSDIPPLYASACNFHYEYKSPIIAITSLKRHVQLSHWAGKVSVEENYAIKHYGARLDKEFSRLQYQLTSHVLDQTNVLTSLVFDLPASAEDAYFRDEIGNVSTSHFRREETKSRLEIYPRFPLFGGWGTAFYFGYDAALKDFVHLVKGKYMLKLDFVNNVRDMTADQVELMVVLPEGASHIEVIPPSTFDMDKIEQSKYYTYFDSTGRPAVEFHKTNVISEHERPIFISYEYPSIRLLQKPAVASVGFFLVSLLSILVSKAPWKIGHEQEATATIELHKHEPAVIIKKNTATAKKRSATPASRESSPFPVFVDENAVAANTRARKPHIEPVLLEDSLPKKLPPAGGSKKRKINKKAGK
ncbi:dolichyl-diphosphooligosaccharide--protein glycosyltransferase subunit 1 [Mucor ambiguus]|uniref:Dolichyl-diphosphooligosaccharide--protein glycosyltransferase subunit 1 n=1 Tax=Mucor ambiguus TaxID=91626 RepID=A0A0C9MGD5_9FUNG|nr:dolichyl-diphosphooligosaccharide--protein glycosyltransferase subunit 1 [Mucor ambiguus]